MIEPGDLARATGFLTDTVDDLGKAITAQGIGVSEKLDHASVRVADAVGPLHEKLDDASATVARAVAELTTQTLELRRAIDSAATASGRYASRLVFATWALVIATVVLAVVAIVR